MNTDLISGFLVFGISSLAWGQSRAFTYHGGVFVNWILLILFGLGMALLFKGFVRWRKREQKDSFWLEEAHKGQVIGLLFWLFLYIFLLPKLGFLISSILSFSFISLMLTLTSEGKGTVKSWLFAFGLGFSISLFFYVVFKYGLLVPLPPGSIWIN